jgi:hypothetical protein
MDDRFELRKAANGWLIWDTLTDTPASVYGRWQTDMDMEEADDLTDLLNALERRRITTAARPAAPAGPDRSSPATH